MTRKQVAERLGKSIATVRRLEGVLLHPTLDSRGQRVFDADEVAALVEQIRSGKIALWQQMRSAVEQREGIPMSKSSPIECSRCAELEEELARVRNSLAEHERRSRRELDALRAERDQERAANRAGQRELERELRRFVDEVMHG